MNFKRGRNEIVAMCAASILAVATAGGLSSGCGGGSEAGEGGAAEPPPSTLSVVTDLVLTKSAPTAIALRWTAPSLEDPNAKAAAYDMRYSTSPINEGNWATAFQADGEPAPQSAGSLEQMTVGGLSPGTAYYFAFRAREFSGAIGPVSNPVRGTTTEFLTSGVVHVAACSDLTQQDTTYILDADVRSDGTCFKIDANSVILDLNGHRILYDDFPGAGLPNPGFELGTGSVPSDWDLTQASTATRRSTALYAMDNQWYLYFGNAPNGSRVVSPWTDLPPSKAAAVYFVRGDKLWAYQTPPKWNITIEFEDGSVVLSRDFTQDQVFAFTSRSTPGNYRAILTLVDGYGLVLSQYGAYPSFDLFDLRLQKHYGVVSEYKNNVIVRNGSIVQGRGQSLYGHGVYINGEQNVTVEDLRVENAGMEASSIYTNWSSGVKIDNCSVVSRNPYVFSRMQLSGAVMAFNGSKMLITNNDIDAGSGWGGIVASNREFEIAYNRVRTKSAITNHHGIATTGVVDMISPTSIRIHHNTVEADPGQGILTAPSSGEIYNNTITIRKTAPNFEYGHISFDGMTFKDYGNRTCKDLKVYNNTINLFGVHDPYYTGYEGDEKVINGIMNMCTGGPVVFDNNHIVARSVEPEVTVTGIEPGGKYGNPVVFSNNVIESDMANIAFGGYAGQGDILPNIRFIANTLVKGSNPVNYHTFGMERTGNIKSDGIRFLDTKLLGGASLLNVQLPGTYGRFSYFVDWSVDVLVTDSSGAPVPDARVTFKDKNMAVVYSGTTGEDGRISSVTLTQLQHVGNGVTASSTVSSFTPCRVEISTGTGSPAGKDFVLDGRKTVTYAVGGQITVADRI